MMNITKYKLFPTILINGRGIITGTSSIKILSFLVYITKFISQRWCVWPFYQQSSHVYQYGSILPSYPFKKQLFEGIF